jgi:lipopolysaccharide transport protein LptA
MRGRFFLFGAIFFVYALSPERLWKENEPLNFSSQKARADDGRIELLGAAHLWQTELDIKADKIILYQNKSSELTKVTALGNVVGKRKEQKSGEWVIFSANKAFFVKTTSKIRLQGGVRVVKAQSVVRGEKMLYDVRAETLHATSTRGQLRWVKK